MIIKTKFKIGDVVYFIDGNGKVKDDVVTGIHINVFSKEAISVKYRLGGGSDERELMDISVFASKEELIASL